MYDDIAFDTLTDPVPAPPRPPHIPGLVPERLLGVGGRSAVWLVHRRSAAAHSVTWVGGAPPERLALKVPLAHPRSAPSLHSAQRELEAMLPLLHEHLVRPWGVARSPQGQTGLLLQAFTAGSLARLQRSAGPLSPGECVTALSPIAQALAQLHDHGAAHGDVSAANILLTPEGRPALGDLADAVMLGMDAVHGTPEEDVRSLASVAWRCLTGREPAREDGRIPLQSVVPEASDELTELLEASMGPAAAQRPLASEFAAELFECAAPEPLDLLRAVDDDALAEVPTVLPRMGAEGRRGGAVARCARNVLRLLRGPARRRAPAHSLR